MTHQKAAFNLGSGEIVQIVAALRATGDDNDKMLASRLINTLGDHITARNNERNAHAAASIEATRKAVRRPATRS